MLPVIYDGTGKAPPEQIQLQAGPLMMLYEAGMLRYIRLGSIEIVRGIYAAVRDENWGTVPGELLDTKVDVRQDSFKITFTSDHGVFRWDGEITGDANGAITFSFDGEALTEFKRNRIGFCVLHPMQVAGVACEVEHVDGTQEQGVFPQYIAPHQPFFDIQAITHQVNAGVRAEVRMEGDAFEMEDQRNWIDASFKTYCTPLRLPFPVMLEKGEKVQQTVTVRLIGQPPVINTGESPPLLVLDTKTSIPLPSIGLCVASHGEPLNTLEVDRLKALNLAHLRVDLDVPGNISQVLSQAAAEAAQIGCELEIAVHLDDIGDLTRVCEAVEKVQPPIARFLIFQYRSRSSPPAMIEAAKGALAVFGAPIGSGTDAYFTELNRNRPSTDLDWVSYSINPQVHAFDNTSLVETLMAAGITVETARQFSAHAKIAVTPITFKIRWNPNATAPDVPTPPDILPHQVDTRQMSLFGAVWTLGSLKSLIAAGADSLTYYETTGWLGLMERKSGSPLPELFPSTAGEVFPMYYVFKAIGEFRGGEMLPLQASQPLVVDGFVLHKGDKQAVLLANYTSKTQKVTLKIFDQIYTFTLDPYSFLRLDQQE